MHNAKYNFSDFTILVQSENKILLFDFEITDYTYTHYSYKQRFLLLLWTIPCIS